MELTLNTHQALRLYGLLTANRGNSHLDLLCVRLEKLLESRLATPYFNAKMDEIKALESTSSGSLTRSSEF